jgi:hypothetical protein
MRETINVLAKIAAASTASCFILGLTHMESNVEILVACAVCMWIAFDSRRDYR